MGWSNEGTIFTIPSGATTGERIVIDGIAGTITGYDANNNTAFVIGNGDIVIGYAPHSQIVLNANGVDNMGNTAAVENFPTNAAIEGFPAQIYSSYVSASQFMEWILKGPNSNVVGFQGFYDVAFQSGSSQIPQQPSFSFQYTNAAGVTSNVWHVVGGSAPVADLPWITDSWQTLSLGNGWTAGRGAQCRFTSTGEVCFSGAIVPGITTDGTVVGSVPAGYAPRTSSSGALVIPALSLTGAYSGFPSLKINTNDQIQCFGVNSASVASISLDGLHYPSQAYLQ